MEYQKPLKNQSIKNITEFKKAFYSRFHRALKYVRRKNEKTNILMDRYLVKCTTCNEEISQTGWALIYGSDFGGCPTCITKFRYNKNQDEPESMEELIDFTQNNPKWLNAPWVEKRGIFIKPDQKWCGYTENYEFDCKQGHTFSNSVNIILQGGVGGDCPICHENNEFSKLTEPIINKVKNLSEHYESHKLSIIDAFLIALQADETNNGAQFILREALHTNKRAAKLTENQLEDLIDQEEACSKNIKDIQDRIKLISTYIKDDEDAINGLYSVVGNDLWRYIIKNYKQRKKVISSLKKDTSPLVENFLAEYEEVEAIQIPTFLTNHITKINKQASLCQKLIAYRLLQKHSYGNWAGTGVGKTLSALLSIYLTKSKLVVYVAVNSTIAQTTKTLTKCFGKNINVFLSHPQGRSYSRDKINVVVLNYEKFQDEYYHREIKDLATQHIDMLVIDEIQMVKNREVEKENQQENSQQRENLLVLQQKAFNNNPLLYTLGMSATPVINEPNEAVSILRFLGYSKNIDNNGRGLSAKNLIHLVQVYSLLQTYGFRYKPELHEFASYNEKNVYVPGKSIEEIYELVEKPSILEIEDLLLDGKLEYIKQLLKSRPHDGFIIYTHFVGIAERVEQLSREETEEGDKRLINKIEEAVKSVRKEEKIRLFTSFDRNDHKFRTDHIEDFVNKTADVIIASRPIGTGVDGLQERESCINLIHVILPWTSAEADQINGRIVRQGNRSTKITIYNLIASDYDLRKWSKLNFKRDIFGTMMEGKIPSSLEQECIIIIGNDNTNSWKKWSEQLKKGKVQTHTQAVIINADEDRKRNKRKKRERTNEYSRLKRTSAENLVRWVEENPEKYKTYCEQREKALKKYPEIPRNKIAEHIEQKYQNDKILHIVDVGCGYQAFLQNLLPFHQVYSMDLTDKFDSRIIKGMAEHMDQNFDAHTMDIVVFSLIMNWGLRAQKEQRIRNTKYILKKGGIIYCAEPRPRQETNKMKATELIGLFKQNGFELINKMERECYGKYYYLIFKSI